MDGIFDIVCVLFVCNGPPPWEVQGGGLISEGPKCVSAAGFWAASLMTDRCANAAEFSSTTIPESTNAGR